MTIRASSSSLTPLTLQALAAIVLVALVVTVLAELLYVILAGSVAWALMVIQGLLWLVIQALRPLWTVLRRHVRRATPSAAEIAAEVAPDIVLRPFP